jgi:hypothetical protein
MQHQVVLRDEWLAARLGLLKDANARLALTFATGAIAH